MLHQNKPHVYKTSLLKSLISSLSKVTLTYCAYVTYQDIIYLLGHVFIFQEKGCWPQKRTILPGFPNYV